MYGALDISTSGMVAQRMRLTSISGNIANRATMIQSDGEVNPYRRRMVHFAPGDPSAKTPEGRRLGVHVASVEVDSSELAIAWDPTSPYAYKDGPKKGYVPQSDINPVVEQINALEASRAYEANVVAAEATKSMMAQALRLLA